MTKYDNAIVPSCYFDQPIYRYVRDLVVLIHHNTLEYNFIFVHEGQSFYLHTSEFQFLTLENDSEKYGKICKRFEGSIDGSIKFRWLEIYVFDANKKIKEQYVYKEDIRIWMLPDKEELISSLRDGKWKETWINVIPEEIVKQRRKRNVRLANAQGAMKRRVKPRTTQTDEKRK